VGQGLARAHASGIIHRDIKPGNIMITQDGFVKIVDFGLAKLIGRSRITGSGATLGTIAYMSPEQARSEDSDARADIWALGVVLYEMLTGKLPFRGEIDQAVVYAILNQDPQPVQELRSDIPDECAAVIAKCLHKDPAMRYQSALEFCTALVDVSLELEWTSFSTGAVRAVSVVYGGRRHRRRSAIVVAIAAVVVAAVAVGWYKWDHRSVYTTDVRLAMMPFERLGDEPSKALVDGLSRCTASLLESATSSKESIWVVPYSRILGDRVTPDRAAAAFGVNRLLKGEVKSFREGYRLTLTVLDAESLRPLRNASVGFSPPAAEALSDSIAIALKDLLHVNFNPDASLISGLKSSATASGFLEALGLLTGVPSDQNARQALDHLRIAETDSTVTPVIAVRGLAQYQRFRRSLDAGLPDSSQLRDAEQSLKLALRGRAALPEAYEWMSYVYLWMKRGDERIDVLEKGIRERPKSIRLAEDLGWAYAEEQRYDEALTTFKRLIGRTADYAYGHWSAGWVYWKTGDRKNELTSNERAYELAPGSYRVLNSLGLYFDAEGDFSRARDYFERAYLAEPNCASCSNVGRVLYFEKRYKESARYYEYALDYCDTTQYAYWANLAGSLYYVEGQRDQAKTLYRHAIQLAHARLMAVPDDADTAAMLADFYSMIDDRDHAFALLDRASGSAEPRSVFRIAQVYEHFGQRTQALSYMDRALQLKMPMHEVINEPLMSELLKDPRFAKMSSLAMDRAAKRGS